MSTSPLRAYRPAVCEVCDQTVPLTVRCARCRRYCCGRCLTTTAVCDRCAAAETQALRPDAAPHVYIHGGWLLAALGAIALWLLLAWALA